MPLKESFNLLRVAFAIFSEKGYWLRGRTVILSSIPDSVTETYRQESVSAVQQKLLVC